MKILHVNYSDGDGGAAIAVKRLHNILNQKKIDSYLLVSEKKYNDKKTLNIPKNSEKIKNLIKNSLNRKLSSFFKMNNFNSFSLNVIPSKLLKKINQVNPDIVNLHWIGNETISIKDIKKIKSKIVWTMHDMWPFCGTEHYTLDDGFIDGYKIAKKKKFLNFFDIDKYIWNIKKNNYDNVEKVICTSEWMYNKVKVSKLFKDKKIKLIALPIDQDFWKPLDKKFAKNFFNINKNDKIIVYGADNFIANKRKGFDILIDTIKALKNENKFNFRVLTFGETKNLDNFKHLNIENLGYINDKYTKKLIYSAADVTVIPSTIEAFGLVAQEANHCGSPCVIFNDTGLTSIVENKINGYVASYKSISDLKNGIKWCLEEMSNKEKIINSFVKSKFDTEKIVKSYLDFLNS